MIRDARVLQVGFIPKEIEHRDAEVDHLSSVLEPPIVLAEQYCSKSDFSMKSV